MEENVPQALSYTECLAIAQKLLNEIRRIKHGRLKEWCDEHNLYYKTIVKLKNGKHGYYAPQMVITILTIHGYSVTLTRKIINNQRNFESEEDVFIVEKGGAEGKAVEKEEGKNE